MRIAACLVLVLFLSCSEEPHTDLAPEPPTSAELARRVCELAKPAFDEIGASLAAGRPMKTAPFKALPGIESTFSGVRVGYVESALPDALRIEQIQGEPTLHYPFEDLDLHCWVYEAEGDHGGIPFDGGWVLLRVYRSQEDPEWNPDKLMYRVWRAWLHVRAIGDIRWENSDAEGSGD